MKRKYKVGQIYSLKFFDHPNEIIIEITKVTEEKIYYKPLKNGFGFNFFEVDSFFYDNAKLLNNESIHVYRKGQEVHAIKKVGKEVVEHTVAKCSPEDTFDFREGAMLALDRLFFEHLKKPKFYNAKLVCVDDNRGFCDFKVGKIYDVVDGFLYLNNDVKYGRDFMNVEPFTDLKDINEKMAPTFIELVED